MIARGVASADPPAEARTRPAPQTLALDIDPRPWWLRWLGTGIALALCGLSAASRVLLPGGWNAGPVSMLAVAYAAYKGDLGDTILSTVAAMAWPFLYLATPARPFHYTPENLLRLLTLTAAVPTVSVAVARVSRRARLFGQEVARRNARLAALNAVATALLQRPLDVDGLLHDAAAAIATATGAVTVAAYLTDPDADHGLVRRVVWAQPGQSALPISVGSDLCDRAVRAGRALMSTPQELPARRDASGRPALGWALAAPMLAAGTTVGTLGLIRLSPFAAQDVELAEALAAQVAGAALNARLYLQSQVRSHRLETLHALTLSLAAERRIDPLLKRLADAARSLVDADYAMLAVEEGSRVTHWITAGLPAEEAQEERRQSPTPPESFGFLGSVVRTGRPLRIADLPAHPAGATYPPDYPAVRSLLAAPMTYAGHVLGPVCVARRPGAPAFTAEDEWAVTALASLAAAALHNASRFEQPRRPAD